MSVTSLGLAVLWLLPLASGQNHAAAPGSTEARSPVSETPTAPSTMSVPGTPTASAPPRFDRSTAGRKSTTEKPLNSTRSSADDSTGTTRAPPPPPPGSSAQTPGATRPTPSPSLISTASASTGPVESGGTSASPVPATRSPASYRTPKAATRPGKEEEPDEGPNHGKVVAGLIGGALLVMVVGFLLIYAKKRRLQNRQMATGDWAGPSPFLAGGADDRAATTRPSNRFSLSSFLTQRLSRRLSALPETGEEFVDMTAASTFGGKGSSIAREDGKAGLGPGGRSNGDAPETAEHNNNNNNSEVA